MGWTVGGGEGQEGGVGRVVGGGERLEGGGELGQRKNKPPGRKEGEGRLGKSTSLFHSAATILMKR